MGTIADNAYRWIITELEHRRPVAESMARLVDLCEATCPHPDWSKLRSLPYADLAPLAQWLERPFRHQPHSVPLRGLWFGLFNPCRLPLLKPSADIYLCGSERFHTRLHDNSWAVRPDWWPDARYARSNVLASIYRIAFRRRSWWWKREQALADEAEYALCLGYASFAVRDLLERVPPSHVLGGSKALGVAVGFDDGDFVLIGELTQRGVAPITAMEPAPERPGAILQDLKSTDDQRVFFALTRVRNQPLWAQMVLADLARLATEFHEADVREAAVASLEQVARHDVQAKTIILRALGDSSPLVRRQALQAVMSVENTSADDLARIDNMQHDPDQRVVRWSHIASERLRRAAITPHRPASNNS